MAITLNGIFRDKMVFQWGAELRVFGFSDQNCVVKCALCKNGEEISTGLILIPAADQDNRWPEGADGSNAGRKFIMNRRLYILRDGIIYDVLGNQVKSYQTY